MGLGLESSLAASLSLLRLTMTIQRASTFVLKLLLVYCSSTLVSGAPTAQLLTVSLDYGTFQGATTGDLDLFLGIPFARAP